MDAHARVTACSRFFCGMIVFRLIRVKTTVVETKGVPIAEIGKKLGTQ